MGLYFKKYKSVKESLNMKYEMLINSAATVFLGG